MASAVSVVQLFLQEFTLKTSNHLNLITASGRFFYGNMANKKIQGRGGSPSSRRPNNSLTISSRLQSKNPAGAG
jgi:hypothetical protein